METKTINGKTYEVYTHNRKGEELFTTFRMVQPDIYEFVGLQTADYELEKKEHY